MEPDDTDWNDYDYQGEPDVTEQPTMDAFGRDVESFEADCRPFDAYTEEELWEV